MKLLCNTAQEPVSDDVWQGTPQTAEGNDHCVHNTRLSSTSLPELGIPHDPQLGTCTDGADQLRCATLYGLG
jgi:hypothetical protein